MGSSARVSTPASSSSSPSAVSAASAASAVSTPSAVFRSSDCRRIILLRHGLTEFNATTRMQGQLDTELSEVGREQARRASRYLSTLGVSRIVSSDLSRAHDTARVVAECAGLHVTCDRRLRETDLGEWQGRTHADIDAVDTGARMRWRLDAEWAPPGGETRLDVARRAREVVDELMADDSVWPGPVVLVAHGGTINALTGNLLGLATSAEYAMLATVGNTCWAQLAAWPRGGVSASTRIAWDNARWTLEGWNCSVNPGLDIASPAT